MTDDPISRVAIIGTGQMGPTVAVATTLAGCAMICRLRPGHQPHPTRPAAHNGEAWPTDRLLAQ